ncbi:oligosaccharyl transferase subunit ost3/OST6 [Paecilomyces lecythidis]|uniref:Oligosaccharyl transferase subunit ost3/OST6 n=1 Tax=Paecilomyces lecythidis TaxID=3004212 RepID=A0ABR3WTY8_9EURO
MKLFLLVIAAFQLCGLALSARPELDKFTKFQAQAHYGHLALDDSTYEEITSKPRDYHVAVLLTAVEARYGCALCREFQPEWELVARSWNKGAKPEDLKLLFSTLDFNNGRQAFQKLMLQTAPVVLLFPPTIGPSAQVDGSPFRLDFSGPISAEQVYAWISRHLPEGDKPPLVRPVNYMRLVSILGLFMGTLSLLAVTSPYVIPIVRNRNLWAAISLISILLFTSGHMFNHIRKVPYVAGDGRGGISYFAGGFANQFGMETQIIAAIYGILSFATIALALKVPRMSDTKAQQMAVVIWGVVLLGVYSFLLSVFRIKNGGYPFFLPPF